MESSESDETSNSPSEDVASTSRKRKYKQNFRSSWLKDKRFEKWIVQEGEGIMCKYCRCYLQPKLYGLVLHAKTKKHMNAMSPFLRGTQTVIPFQAVKVNKDVVKAELSNAIYIAAHTSIRSIDHLVKLQQNIFSDSKTAGSLKLGRTKCSAVIKNVLFPYFKNLLLADVGTNIYSLIIDESTDISVRKYLGIVIRYYSASSSKIVNTFLRLAELDNFTAQGIVASIVKTLNEYELDIKNMVGIGTDNANVMTGINRGVIARLTEFNPKIKLIPCICHSIQIAVASASKAIPSEIEFLVSQTYNWFSKSALRQNHYKAVFSAINDGLQPNQIVRACDTRWLSIEVAIKRIVDQWLELKTHFGIAEGTETCHKAKLLFSLLNDINLAYLQFLKPLLGEVQKINKLFESNDADPTKLFSELVLLITGLCSYIISPCNFFDPLSTPLQPYLTSFPSFHFCFEEYIKLKKTEKTIDNDTEVKIRKVCQTFLVRLIEQLRQRLPQNIESLKNIDFFSVKNAMNVVKCSIFVSFQKEKSYFTVDEITAIELQWKKICTYPWKNVNSTIGFWIEVKAFKNAINENPFEELVNFVFAFLILPLSNAEIERSFSVMNAIKTKQRNRLNLIMLNSLLTVRYGLKRLGKCCHDFAITEDLIKLLHSCNIYDSSDTSDIESIEFEI